ncbi:MAG: hypothetical protein ACK5JC_10545 [Bacteroidota bacterium]|jgi:hypothetical protein
MIKIISSAQSSEIPFVFISIHLKRTFSKSFYGLGSSQQELGEEIHDTNA